MIEFKEGHTVGIDLGTTFSTLAQIDEDGNPVAIPNEDDEVETASLVLLAESGHVIVGPNRTRAAMEDPSHVVERIKRHMGEHDFQRTFDGREITPEFFSALILKKLKQDAEKRIGKIGNAVITVPYYFNDQRRKATQDAGRIAGLNVVDIINEPTAATLTYAWHRGELGAAAEDDRPHTALIYDLGGGTFDVTLVWYTPTHFRVLATDGDVQLGGVDWNDRLLDHVCTVFKEKYDLDPKESANTVHVLRNDCDIAKLELSEKNETQITCRHKGKTLQLKVTRNEFERLTADLVQRTIDTTELVLAQGKLAFGDLDAIVLVGGSTLMPQIGRAITASTGREPYRGISPFAAVAQGAAIHAAILEAKYRGDAKLTEKIRRMLAAVRQENVNSHGVGIVATDPKSGRDRNFVMIPRNTPLPAEKRQVFRTKKVGQNRISIQVLEGDAPDPTACSLLGKFRVSDLPKNLPQGSPIEVTYAFDPAGRINVRAEDLTGHRMAGIAIERRGGLRDGDIDAYTRLAQEYVVD